GSDIVVPGVGPGEAVRIERGRGVWTVHSTSYNVRVRFDGRLITSPRDLRRHDVLTIGDAQVVVTDVSRTLLRLDVCHLVGNATIVPATTLATLALTDGGDEDLEIHAPGTLHVPPPTAVGGTAPASAAGARRQRWLALASVAV